MSDESAAGRAVRVRAPMKAEEIMQRPVVAATPRASLRDIAVQLLNNEFSGMPVVAPNGTVIGVVTEADIVRALAEGRHLENLTAADVMTGTPITVDVDTSIEDVMKRLQENQIIRVPVTNKNVLVGIIARADVIRAALEPEFIRFQ